MQIIRKIAEKAADLKNADIPTIAFLGDSVTQGCFEVYMTNEGTVETVFEAENGYHNCVAKILRVLYPRVPVAIINAGISGDNAQRGFARLQRDVLRFHPDLVVVSFGLNDAVGAEEGLEHYKDALDKIFTELKKAGCEVIFMTENMKNTYVSHNIKDEYIRNIAVNSMQNENSGTLKRYFDAAKEIAGAHDVVVCDVYSKWKRLEENGVDTTALLANDINHPCREMNWLFAYSLVDVMMDYGGDRNAGNTIS